MKTCPFYFLCKTVKYRSFSFSVWNISTGFPKSCAAFIVVIGGRVISRVCYQTWYLTGVSYIWSWCDVCSLLLIITTNRHFCSFTRYLVYFIHWTKERQQWNRGFRRNLSLQGVCDTSIMRTTGFIGPHPGYTAVRTYTGKTKSEAAETKEWASRGLRVYMDSCRIHIPCMGETKYASEAPYFGSVSWYNWKICFRESTD